MRKSLALLLALAGASLFLPAASAGETAADLTRPSSPPGPGWALDRINQANLPLDGAATRYLDAAAVTVYVVDSGIYGSSEEFGSRLRPANQSYTAFRDSEGAPQYTDSLSWHGTAVASIIGGRIHGVAPSVRLVSVKVTSPALRTADQQADDLIGGLQWILTDPQGPAADSLKVVNISLLQPSSPTSDKANGRIDSAVRDLIRHGITVVVGAGNGLDEGKPTARAEDACEAGSPARLGTPDLDGLSTITVSATDAQDNPAYRPCSVGVCQPREGWFANYGPCVDVFAPGDRVGAFLGPDPYAPYTEAQGAGAEIFDGTSAAAPYVTGLVAHLVAANAGNSHPRTPAQIEERVKALATYDLLRLPGVPGDFDNDGYSDVLLHNQATGNVAAWLMTGMTYQTVINLPGISNTQYQIGGAADFDRDGDPDIVWNNATTGANAIWKMRGPSLEGVVNLPNPLVGFTLRGTGDFNGDGQPDLLVRNAAGSFAAIWLLQDMVWVETVNLPGLPDNFELSGAGDFNGDGQPDIVWRNISNGANAVWLMNGPAFSSILNLPPLLDLGHHIGAVADYNGDGKPDLVWRNRMTGADMIWIMNGATISQVVNLPTLNLPDWDIQGPK